MIGEEHHVSSLKLLLSVFGALIFLTILTAAMHYIYLPHPWAIIVAMVIGLLKASLVAFFFMNLYWDKKFNLMAFIASVVFLGLLIGFTLLDVLFRTPTDYPW